MVSLSISYDKKAIGNIDRFINKFPNEVSRATLDTAKESKKIIIRDTPKKTGRARRSWELKKLSPFEFQIFSNDEGANAAPYTQWLEDGTRAHGPLTAKALRFPIIKGNTITGWVTTKRVRGIKAYGMVKNNVGNITRILTEKLRATIKTLWDKL